MKLQRNKSRADVPSMAMGDIAFNLLIFFVILAKAQDDSHLQWKPASAPKLETAGRSIVSVLVDNQNKLYLNGQELGAGELAGRIEQLLGNSPPGDRTVLLKVHSETQAQRFEPIIEAIGEAGGEMLHVLDKTQE